VPAEPAPLVSPGESLGGTLYPGFTATVIRFNRPAGEDITVSLDAPNDGTRWHLIDPNGLVGLSAPPGSFDLGAATESGVWSILIQGHEWGWDPVNYVFSVTYT
jgi:hypothetical protein